MTELAQIVAPGAEDRDVRLLGARYDEATIAAKETDRERRHRSTIERWRARLVDGPTLTMPGHDLSIVFNPTEALPLADRGTVYPTATIRDVWGSLTVSEGVLLDPSWKSITVSAYGLRQKGTRVTGDGWTLDMNDGWNLLQDVPSRYRLVPDRPAP